MRKLRNIQIFVKGGLDMSWSKPSHKIYHIEELSKLIFLNANSMTGPIPACSCDNCSFLFKIIDTD